MPQSNPFRYGKPVPPAHFFGRADAVRTVFNRIRVGDSTAIVGLPHIGKSSLLRYLADAQVRTAQLRGHPAHHAFVEIDCHLLPQTFVPEDFWKRVWSRLRGAFPDPEIQQRVADLQHGPFDHMILEDHFSLLGSSDARVVLLIDEFDSLLFHPRFCGPDFFGALRSLSSRTDGLILVTASRLSVTKMNKLTGDSNRGSPFFNNIVEVRLQPLHEPEMHQLLDHELHGSSVLFNEEDWAFLERESGRHPYLLQAAAASLFDALIDGAQGEDRFTLASQVLYERTAAFQSDLQGCFDESVTPAGLRLHCSHSPKDRDLREELEVHLSLLRWQGLLSRQRDVPMDEADIILLLVSADFLATHQAEAQRALERERAKKATVIPVLVRQALWKDAPFGKLQGLPADGRPVTSWPSRDEAWYKVAEGIQAVAIAKR